MKRFYRILEKKLDDQFTCSELIDTLRNMRMQEIDGEGYVPTYIWTYKITDALHDIFGFRTDFEIVTQKNIKKTKKQNSTQFLTIKKTSKNTNVTVLLTFLTVKNVIVT